MAQKEYYKCINEKIANIVYEGIIYNYKDEKYLKATVKNDSVTNGDSDKASIITINNLYFW